MIPNIYKEGDYRLLAIVPTLLIIASLFFIPNIKQGVEFQGGTLITLSLDQQVDAESLEANLKGEGLEASVKVFDTPVGYKAEIEMPQNDELVRAEELKGQFRELLPEVQRLEIVSYEDKSYQAEYKEKKKELDTIADEMFDLADMKKSELNLTSLNKLQEQFTDAYSAVYDNYQDKISASINRYVAYNSISVKTVGPVLSAHLIEQTKNVIILSALLSVVLVFLFFRSIPPSVAVITGAVADVTIALGAMGLLGIPLTLNSFAALLMLIGYSLDTDILLTTRMLKRKGDPREKAYDAMKTGLTMSVTGLVAFIALFILGISTHIPTYYEISAVALAGIVADMFATWGINAVMILYYMEKRSE